MHVLSLQFKYIGGAMVNMLTWIEEDSGFEAQSINPKTMKLVCYFSVKHIVLKSMRKDWLARNQDIMPCKVLKLCPCLHGQVTHIDYQCYSGSFFSYGYCLLQNKLVLRVLTGKTSHVL